MGGILLASLFPVWVEDSLVAFVKLFGDVRTPVTDMIIVASRMWTSRRRTIIPDRFVTLVSGEAPLGVY